MCIGTSVSAWRRVDADSSCPLYPLLDSKDESVASGFGSNVTEFRNIKIGVVEAFEDAKVVKWIASVR